MAPPAREPQLPWDPGLQPERTALAWVRTGLALTVVSLLLTRLTAGSGALALAVGLCGMAVGAALVVAQSRRHRRTDTLLRSGRLRPALGASAGLVVAVVLLAAAALFLVLAPRS